MTIEAEASPAPVADDATDTEANELNTDLQTGDDGDDDGTSDGNLESDLITIERNGKSYTIPKDLEAELLMQSDYTKKTMTLADERKAAEAVITADRQAVQQRAADIDTYVALKNLETEMAPYLEITAQQLAQLRANDPLAADKIERDYDRLERAIERTKQTMAQRATEQQQAMERATATQREQVLTEAAKAIPNFTDERRTQLEKLAVEHGGYTADQLRLASAGDYKMLDLAAEGLRARQERQKAAKLQAAAGAEPASEVVKGRTPVLKPLDDRASTDAWMKARNATAAKR